MAQLLGAHEFQLHGHRDDAADRVQARDFPERLDAAFQPEIGGVHQHRVRRGDDEVAVILDHEVSVTRDASGKDVRTTKPRDPAQVQRISGLVAAAVGLDTTRGDQLTVESIAFDEPELVVPDGPSTWERYQPQIMEGARVLVVALLGLLAFFFVVRPVMKRVLHSPSPETLPQRLPDQLPRTVQDLEGEIEAHQHAPFAPIFVRKRAAETELTADVPPSESRN